MSSAPSNAASPAMSMIGRVNLQQYVVYVGFLAIFLFFAVVLKDSGFLTVRNLSNIVLQTAPIDDHGDRSSVFVHLGGRDRPVHRLDRRRRSPLPPPSPCRRLRHGRRHRRRPRRQASLIGLVNGVLVAYVRLPSFLVTLATLGLFAGVSRSMTDLRSIPVTNEHLHRLLRLRRAARAFPRSSGGRPSPSPSATSSIRETTLRRACAGGR